MSRDAMRRCVKCGARDRFPSGACRPCKAAYQSVSGPTREQKRARNLRNRFGITTDDYERILDDQGGVCAVCLMPPGTLRLAVEHDHETGEITGLVHTYCNTYVVDAVRAMRADPELLPRVLRLIAAKPAQRILTVAS